jgi:RNA polymerase sigma factor (sigma-70 family)
MDDTRSQSRIAEFFRTEYARMSRFVAGLIEDEADRDAEDVVQDVMLNLFNMADVTRPIQDLSAYIYRALRNRVTDTLRKRRRDVSLDAPAPAPGDEGRSLADILADARYDTAAEFEKNEIRDRVFRAIDSLGEEERTVLVMTEFEGSSSREAAERIGIPVGTLLSKKSRALAKIRNELGPAAQY